LAILPADSSEEKVPGNYVTNLTIARKSKYNKRMVGSSFYSRRFSIFLVPAFFTFAGSAAAQSTAPQPGAVANPCVPPPETFLAERLAFWQQQLNVADWKISIVMSHPSDLKPETLGNIHWDVDKKTAVIRVQDAADYQLACPDMLADMEFTVVHELVHLVLSSLPRSEASRSKEEHAVNQITDALLKLDRLK
jgi:hypothetical protein